MTTTPFERTLGFICYMVASASLGALYWAYELGDLGFALCVGSALFFAQWGWNLRHSDPDRQDQWLDQL